MEPNRFKEREFRQLVSKTGENYSLSSVLSQRNNLLIHEEILAPNHRASAPHSHPQADEAIYILKGECTLVLGDVEKSMKEGDFVNLEASNQLHFIRNYSLSECKFLVMRSGEGKAHFKES